MAEKPLDKITIHDLTERCGIRRQNFYYHFEDIYDLLRRMFEEEASALMELHSNALLQREGLLQLLQYIEENKTVYLCALHSVGREPLKRLFAADIYSLVHHTVEQIVEEIGASPEDVSEDEMSLMTHFYVVAAVGFIESWLSGEIDHTPEEMAEFIDQMLQDHIAGARARWAAAKAGND